MLKNCAKPLPLKLDRILKYFDININTMQKLLIYNKGYSDTGKSRALKAVFFRLVAEHGELIQVKRLLHGSLDFCNTEDLGVIFTYRGILVGLESEGDPKGTYHEKALTEFKE